MFTLVVTLSILYIILGSIGMTVNLCVTLLICFSSKFKNPTYTYIVNHLASDMLCLFPISIYTGFCMLIGEKYLERLMSVLVDLGWYPSGFFYICIAATRVMAIGSKTRLEETLTKKATIVTISIIWIPYIIITGGYMFNDQKPSGLDFRVYTWWYDTDVAYGYYMNIYYAYHGVFTSILIVILNIIAIALMRQKLRNIHPNVQSTVNRNRERKLFRQCLITSMFYSFTAFMYTTLYESTWGQSLELEYYAIFHIVWIFNHSSSSVIYFLFNRDLINIVKKFFNQHSSDRDNKTRIIPHINCRKKSNAEVIGNSIDTPL